MAGKPNPSPAGLPEIILSAFILRRASGILRSMNIGLARRGYSPTGGAENYLRRLGGELAKAGHGCTLFASPEWPREHWLAEQAFCSVPGGSPRAFADSLAALKPRHRCDLLFSLERVWSCDCYRAGDGVHRAWLERRARMEPVWRSRLRRWNPKHRQLLALEEALFGHGGARTVIANSEMVRAEITEHYPACPAERIQVVYNGLPVGHFQQSVPGVREHSRSALGLEPEDFAILFTGTGWERKGLACALAAVSRLPDVPRPRLLVAGRGNPRPYLRPLDRKTAGRVRFLGPVSDMAAVYAAADVFVLPTLYDPFSNACLEALAAGLPVLTTRANGFGEILAPGVDGEVFADADDGGEALAALIAGWFSFERRRAARPACSAKAASFTIERNVSETLDVLSRL